MMYRYCSAFLVLCVISGAPLGAEEQSKDQFRLECTPTQTLVPQGWGPRIQAPEVSVVDTEIRPGRTRLLLDGKAIGRAKEYDGYPGSLFLSPGHYRLEAVLGGYRSAVFEIEARSECLFEIRHRMQRIPGSDKEGWREGPTVPKAQYEVFEPVQPPSGMPVRQIQSSGPDLSLRPDLIPRGGRQTADQAPAGGLRFAIQPPQAAVYLDGAFVGIAEELGSLEQVLAVVAGDHQLEVVAPGYVAHQDRIEVLPDAEFQVDVELTAQGTGHGASDGP